MVMPNKRLRYRPMIDDHCTDMPRSVDVIPLADVNSLLVPYHAASSADAEFEPQVVVDDFQREVLIGGDVAVTRSQVEQKAVISLREKVKRHGHETISDVEAVVR